MRFRDHVLQLYRGQRTFYRGVYMSPAELVVGIDINPKATFIGHRTNFQPAEKSDRPLRSHRTVGHFRSVSTESSTARRLNFPTEMVVSCVQNTELHGLLSGQEFVRCRVKVAA